MKGVKYIGPVWDQTGYGEASRNYVLGLYKTGVPITLEPFCFENNPPPVGSVEDRRVLKEVQNKDIDFDIVIVHLTPDLAPRFAEKYKDKYVISYTVWETCKLHPHWVDCCNKMREVWVPSQWNVEVFKDSGVKVPVYRMRHGIDSSMYENINPENFSIQGIDKNKTFVFLSVLQWNSRKNPEGLIRSYLNAFTVEDNVRLVLKCYIGGGLAPDVEKRHLFSAIKKIKADMNLPNPPKINLVVDQLSSEKLRELYSYCDAYISLNHGEGFGLTMAEAGLAGKPVIATGFSGNMEYMDEENSYPVPYMLDYVSGMSTFNHWYLGSQLWANPDLITASRLMRRVIKHREESAYKGRLLRKKIKEEFSWDAVVKPMIERLESI